jgi:hypothetical protein
MTFIVILRIFGPELLCLEPPIAEMQSTMASLPLATEI